MTHYIIWRGEEPTVDQEKYVWYNEGVCKIWDGFSWRIINQNPGEQLDESVIPTSIARKTDLINLLRRLFISGEFVDPSNPEQSIENGVWATKEELEALDDKKLDKVPFKDNVTNALNEHDYWIGILKNLIADLRIDITNLQNGAGIPIDLTTLKLKIGDPTNPAERNHLFISYDNGSTWVDIGEFVDTGSDIELSGYVDWNTLQELYYTKLQCNNRFVTKAELGLDGLEYYRTFTIYKRTDSAITIPAVPLANITAVWDVTHGVLNLPEGYTEWKNHPDNASSQTPYLWITSATFRSSDGSMVDDSWETPICLTGKDGGDGEDGKGIEFIYHLGELNAVPTIGNSRAYKSGQTTKTFVDASAAAQWWVSEDSVDWLPDDGTNDGFWTDNPSGIEDDDNKHIEFASIRISHYDANSKETIWGDFCTPFIWSMWGEDGTDGDGVEYIFAVAAENETIVDAQTGKRELNASFFRGQSNLDVLPLTDQEIAAYEAAGGNYQISDWCPDGTIKHGVQMRDLNWTDNPSDVGPDQPYEFVAIRKKKLDPVSGEMKWGPFSTPALWGFWGQKTVTIVENGQIYKRPYTCFAFTRSNVDISNYTIVDPWTFANKTYTAWITEDNSRETGYYDNPLDYIITLDENNNVVSTSVLTWSDTVPPASGQLYMITNHIGDESSGTNQGWTSPRPWGDAAGFQVEYAVSSPQTDLVYNRTYTLPKLDAYDIDNIATYPGLVDDDNDGIDEPSWRTAVYNAGMGVWNDENYITDPDYMAVCYKKQEGVWSNWQISRIKGEIGPQGPQGPQGPAGINGQNGNVYTIVPTYSSLKAENPVTSNGTTTYSISGSVGWNLYINGIIQTGGYCEAYLGSTALTVPPSSGSNDFIVTIPNNTTSSATFVQIVWYNDSGKTNFYDGAIIPISIKGEDGNPGSSTTQSIEGPIMRVRQWAPSTKYYSGFVAADDGVKYLDVVWVNDGTSQNPIINYYKCVTGNPFYHTSGSVFSVGSNWEAYAMMNDSVFNTILARSAYIANLTAKQIVITDNNIVVAGMASGSSIATAANATNGSDYDSVTGESVRIWAGALTNSNLQTAPFRVTDNGHLYATNATISGNITANNIVSNTVNGNGDVVPGTSFKIIFGNDSMTTNEPNSLYFLY